MPIFSLIIGFRDMYLIAKTMGFDARQLIRNQATRNAVISAIGKAAGTLKEDNLFMMTFSGQCKINLRLPG